MITEDALADAIEAGIIKRTWRCYAEASTCTPEDREKRGYLHDMCRWYYSLWTVDQREIEKYYVEPPELPTPPERLYGLMYAEILHTSIVDVYEKEIDGTYSEDATVEVEEWTVSDNIEFVPGVAWILDELVEYTANESITEGWYEAASNAWVTSDPQIKRAVERLRRVLADKVKFWMAYKVVKTWVIHVNGGDPRVEAKEGGEQKPLYEKVEK